MLCIAVSAIAAPAEQREIQELYRSGLNGDKEAVEECIAKLEGVLRSQPGNELARVYLGSAYTLRSRDLRFGPKKLQTLKQGLAVMDEAVTRAPDDPKVRLARALTTDALPGIFGRRAQSREDFEQLASLALRQPNRFEPGDLQIVFYNAGLAAKRGGNKARATELWRAALQHPIDTSLHQKVKTALAAPP